MVDPASYRPATGSIPESPGVYRFRDSQDRVVYVGKAKNLRSRLNSYFADVGSLHPRTQAMVCSASRVDWTVVATEVEALQLEYNWIKEFDPRFNVKYRDDKSYPYLAVTVSDDVPRAMVMRGAKRKGIRYFGPYSHAWAIRETLDLLLRVFPMRTCSNGVYRRAEQTGRPCLLGHIGKCAAPCVGWVSIEEHRKIVEDFCDFMAGHPDAYLKRLEREMKQAATEQEYERAARLRDDITALRRAMEKQTVVLADATDADVIAMAEDQLEAAVQVFFVRGGRVRGQRGWVVEKVEDVTTAELVEHFVTQLYGEIDELVGAAAEVPREVLVPELPADIDAVTEWLGVRRGSRVDFRVPQRGDKRALMETVARNAAQSLMLHKTRRAGDLTARGRALQEIQDALELDEAPLRIECYDISNLQGTDVVASMVVFEDGLARKSEYRRFAITSVGSGALPPDLDPHAEPERPSRAIGRLRTTSPRFTKSSPAGSVVISTSARPAIFRWTSCAEPDDTDPSWRRRQHVDRSRHRAASQVRLHTEPRGRRRRPTAGDRSQAGARRARHRRHRAGRPGKATRRGVAPRRSRSGDLAAQQRRPVPAAAGSRRGAPIRDQLSPGEAVGVHDPKCS